MTKKILVIACVVLCFMVFTDHMKAQSKFGIKFGFNNGDISDSDSSNQRSGLSLAAFHVYRLNKNLGIQGEIVYIERNASGVFPTPVQVLTGQVVGGVAVTETLIYDLDVQVELKYLELPIMARFDFNPTGYFRPYIMGGPYIGFQLSSKNIYITEENGRYETDYEDIKTLSLGLNVGAGLGIKLGPDEILVEARYSYGLSKISNSFDGKPRGLTFMVGYAFD